MNDRTLNRLKRWFQIRGAGRQGSCLRLRTNAGVLVLDYDERAVFVYSGLGDAYDYGYVIGKPSELLLTLLSEQPGEGY